MNVPAASVILLRPSESGFEVLLLKRNDTLSFAANYWVFPGGKIDAADYVEAGDEMVAAKQCAIRECMEEAEISVNELKYMATWTAPRQAKPRFRTHFYVAVVPSSQTFTVDGSEIVEGVWLTLEQAAEKALQGAFLMMPPTVVSLVELSQYNSESALADFLQHRPYFDYEPKMIRSGEGACVLYRGDSGWETEDINKQDQLHRLCQQGRGYHYWNNIVDLSSI